VTKGAFLALAATVLAGGAPAAPNGGPSRRPVQGCVWERFSDAKVGLEAWVQRCDFGFRRIDFLAAGRSLAIRYSDGGGAPDRLVDVFDLQSGETPDDGVKRVFRARTEASFADRCVLSVSRDRKPPKGVRRLTFVPNAAYRKQLDAAADPNEVGDPPCGDWGTAPDGIQYFEVHPEDRARRFLFVRVGQDEPLFDEQNLRLLPAP
jgi:hypothetical protein